MESFYLHWYAVWQILQVVWPLHKMRIHRLWFSQVCIFTIFLMQFSSKLVKVIFVKNFLALYKNFMSGQITVTPKPKKYIYLMHKNIELLIKEVTKCELLYF